MRFRRSFVGPWRTGPGQGVDRCVQRCHLIGIAARRRAGTAVGTVVDRRIYAAFSRGRGPRGTMPVGLIARIEA